MNPELIQRAIERLVSRHDALRTVLQVAADGFPRQAFAEVMAVSVPQHDFSRLPDPQAAAQALLQEQMARAYRLVDEPLFRFLWSSLMTCITASAPRPTT